MSKKSKSIEFRPRDPKGRFVKTTKIPLDLFGGKNTPPIYPSQRYLGSTSRKGQSSIINKTQVLAKEQVEFIEEQVEESAQDSEIIEVQTEILTLIYHVETRDYSHIKPFFTKSKSEIETFSLFGNMAGEEEERVLNEQQGEDEEQTFGFLILDLAQNTNM